MFKTVVKTTSKPEIPKITPVFIVTAKLENLLPKWKNAKKSAKPKFSPPNDYQKCQI